MPSSASFLNESGVWCADEESSDDLVINGLKSTSVSHVTRANAKHSGGSVDASGDVEIIDVKEVDSFSRRNNDIFSNGKLRKSIKRKSAKSIQSNSSRKPRLSTRRRSSSFSKIFSYGRKNPDVIIRRSSFGIKRMPSRRAVEIDDADVMWPNPSMFKNSSIERRVIEDSGRSRNKSTSTSITTLTTRSYGAESTLRRGAPLAGRIARSEKGSMTRQVYCRSLTPRPSLASTTIRESHLCSEEQQSSNDASVFYEEEKGFIYGQDDTLNRSNITQRDDTIEEMVESINLRNFVETNEKSGKKKTLFPWFYKQFGCLFLTTVFCIVMCFLLLGLMIWLIQDNNNLRYELHEMKNIMNQNNIFPRDIASSVDYNSNNPGV